MPYTPAQQALDRQESAAFMRQFYAALGMRKLTLERVIQQANGTLVRPRSSASGRQRGRPRLK